MNSDSLSDWLGYINSKRPNEKEFGLERLKGVYSELIKKPIAAKTILIAGTNGKGSTAEFLKNFLLFLFFFLFLFFVLFISYSYIFCSLPGLVSYH